VIAVTLVLSPSQSLRFSDSLSCGVVTGGVVPLGACSDISGKRRNKTAGVALKRGGERDGGERAGRGRTHCVDASVRPSGLKAAAMVDLGGGRSGQYVAVQLRSASPSAHAWSSRACESACPACVAADEGEAALGCRDEAPPPRHRDPSRALGSSSRARSVRHRSWFGPIALASGRPSAQRLSMNQSKIPPPTAGESNRSTFEDAQCDAARGSAAAAHQSQSLRGSRV